MKTRLLIIGLTATLSIAATPVLSATSPAQKMVDRWSKGKALRGLEVALSIVDADNGRSLAGIQPRRVMNPASGTKLLTSAAALHTLPLKPNWETRVHAKVEGDRIEGDLRLIGSGDPKLLIGHLEALADEVKLMGVKRIEGGVVLHVGHFDSDSLPPAYEQKQSDAGYRPGTGALASNFGALRVTVQPGRRVNGPVRVSVEGGLQAISLANTAKTVRGKERNISIKTVQMKGGKTQLLVSGTLGKTSKAHTERKRIHDPDRWTGLVFESLLKARDISIGSALSMTREPLPDDAGPALKRIQGRSLPETLADINTWSNNFMAEMLLKQMGCKPIRPCSWTQAVKRVSEALVNLGLDKESFKFVNGSGLYKATMVSAEAMTTLLVSMRGKGAKSAAFEGSLAVNAKPGTMRRRLLSKRMRGKVKAKTGTLNEVVSLSGYVPTRKGRTLAFALFVNGASPQRTAAIRRQLDRLVARLTRL